MKKQFNKIVVKGFNVPVLSSRKSFKKIDGKLIEQESNPLYVQLIENGDYEAAADELCRTGANDIITQYAPSLVGWSAPLAVSSRVPMGTMVFDYDSERIIVNEFWGDQRGNDSDGK